MILYNEKYEFIGISDSCIKKLNFPSYNALKYRIDGDFANLLIPKKGFVHNFEYISWIEYIQQEKERAKGLIKGGDGIYYQITFEVESYFFAHNGGEKGYLIRIASIIEYDDVVSEDGYEIEQTSNSQDLDSKENYYIDGEFVQESDTFVFDADDEEDENRQNGEIKQENGEFALNASSELPSLDIEEFQLEDSQVESEPTKDNDSSSTTDNILPPDEFLAQFGDTETATDTTEELETSWQFEHRHKLKGRLSQKEIDVLIDGDNSNYVEEENLPIFSTIHYPIDEVAEVLDIDKETLMDFLVDFIHHASQVRTFIYEAIEKEEIEKVKEAIFMIRGLCFNLRIMDIYDMIEKIEKREYENIGVLLKDINSLYEKIEDFGKKYIQEGEIFKFHKLEVKESISNLNNSPLPDFIFQDILDSFIKLFDTSKEKIEESFNPEKIGEIYPLIKEMFNSALSLNIPEIIQPLKNILSNIESGNIEYDRLIVDWIELSSFIDNIR